MYFVFGNHQHDANEVDLTNISITKQYSARNRLMFHRHTLSLKGHLCVSGQDAIKAAIDELSLAYTYDLVAPSQGESAGLYHDDGTPSSHVLYRADSINGIRVMSFNFPKIDGGEYATGRSYHIVLMADYMAAYEDVILEFEESMMFFGNGDPIWEYVPRFWYPPLVMTNFQYTTQKVVQRGRAIGLQANPLEAPPLLTYQQEHGERRELWFGSGQLIGRIPHPPFNNSALAFETRWKYEFELPVAIKMYPHADYPYQI